MKEKIAFGIDFGTTNSLAAGWGDDIRKQEPKPYALLDGNRPHASVVWYSPDSKVIVGNAARAQMQAHGGDMGHRFIRSIKRDLGHDREHEILGGQRLPAYDVAAEIFRHLKDHAHSVQLLRRHEIAECLVTVPVTFTGRQRKDIRRAMERAGIQLKGFLHEPFAAMISHFYDPETKLGKLRNQRVMVFDWGGGTLDVCIVQVSKDGTKIVELAHSGIEDRAGDDFDQRLMAELRTRFLQRNVELRDEDLELQGSVRDKFWLTAENGKITLSKTPEATVTVANFFQRNTKIYDLQETVTRHVFEGLIAGEVEAAVRCVQRCLTQARLTPGCVDHLVLVGGTSNIPLIREQLEALFGHKVQVAQQPDAAIARGAAIVAAEGWRPFNAVPLGVKLCDGSFFDILKRGDRLDAESSRRVVF